MRSSSNSSAERDLPDLAGEGGAGLFGEAAVSELEVEKPEDPEPVFDPSWQFWDTGLSSTGVQGLVISDAALALAVNKASFVTALFPQPNLLEPSLSTMSSPRNRQYLSHCPVVSLSLATTAHAGRGDGENPRRGRHSQQLLECAAQHPSAAPGAAKFTVGGRRGG